MNDVQSAKGRKMTELELKEKLAHTTTPRLGRFGEKLYKHFMVREGFQLQGLHKEKADFIVEQFGRVDVKTKGFNVKTPKLKNRVADTNYCFVELHDDHIKLDHEDEHGNTIRTSDKLSWANALEFWLADEHRLTSANSALKAEILEQTRLLADQISINWGLKPAVIYREGRKTQESMTSGKSPWGPVTFYESPSSKRKIDIKVLLYFDKLDVWQVMAYPIALMREIDFHASRTNSSVTTFNPHTIDKKFFFADVQDFQKNFLTRFGHCF
jgi:hypothetical protein